MYWNKTSLNIISPFFTIRGVAFILSLISGFTRIEDRARETFPYFSEKSERSRANYFKKEIIDPLIAKTKEKSPMVISPACRPFTKKYKFKPWIKIKEYS